MRRVVGVVVVAGVLAAGCSSGGDPPDPGFSATLQRSTLFETRRALLLEVHPDGDRDLRIGAIQLETPLFEAVAPEARDALVQATDRAVAMPLPFGDARCDGDGQDDEPAHLVTDVDGDEVRVELEVSPPGVLADLHAAECAAAGVLDEVDLRLGDSWERTEPRTVVGRVELAQRRPGVTAAVDEVLGNVIFTVTAEGAPSPWLEVSDGRPSASVEVAVSASRCDPHALIEYKRTFTLSAWVGLGDGESVRVDIVAEGAARTALEELLTACLP